MTHRRAVNTANLKPFKKGPDKRRNKGPICKERQTFAIKFNNAIAKRADVPKLVDKLVTLAERGIEWAMKEVLDRTMGKVTQPVGGEGGGPIKHVLSFDFGSDNGSGNGKENG